MLVLEANLTAGQATLLCGAINNCGAGDHPRAEPANVHFFTTEYAQACMEAAMPQLLPDFQAHGQAIIDALGEAKPQTRH